MRKGIFVLLIIVSCLAQAALLPAASLKKVTATFADNRLQFGYDLEGSDREAEVTIRVTVPGRENLDVHPNLEGDLGKVRPGSGKKIVWNILRDFPNGLNAEVDWEIWADKALDHPTKGVWGRIQVHVLPARR